MGMAAPLPAPLSTAGGTKVPTCPSAYSPPPPPPEHVAVDIPAAAADFARLVVGKEGAPTPPPPQQERAATKNHPTATRRPDPFVRTLVKAMWVAYLLTLAPAALVGSALLYGWEATFLVLGVFSMGVITGALFHVREDDGKDEAQAEVNKG